jgi:RNA polymerase sigma-70 factor (ECF subfamily)
MTAGRDEETNEEGRARFDACFEAHYAEVLAYAMRRVEQRATAEDVLAETFAVAWRRRDAIPAPALPWLYAIAARVIANQMRSSRRRLRLGRRLAAQPPRRGHDPSEVIGEHDALVEAFSRLSDSQRELLSLVIWEDLATSDAAAALGCSPTAFRVRLHRARRALAKHLKAAGHSSAAEIGQAASQAAEEMK